LKVVVPLAGPDFVLANGSVKGLIDIGHGPLLHHALTSRAWAGAVAPEDYTFVLNDQDVTRSFAQENLAQWFPGSSTVFLSGYTSGAALSALAGAAPVLTADAAPIVVDLADILYDSTLDPAAHFAADAGTGGIALTFESDNPAYSYLRKDADGVVVEAAEKRVISTEASAGTYAFSSGSVLLRAIAHALDNAPSQTFRDLFFVCPLFNGVLDQGLAVSTVTVENVEDIKIQGVGS